jgi:assimilatory nitrate reductase catalytic subunit
MNVLGANALMPYDIGPSSKQPELKHTTVKVEKLNLPWQMAVMRSCHNLSLLNKIRTLLKHFDYATCGLYGREQSMVVLRASHAGILSVAVIAQLDDLLGIVEGTPMLNYDDAKHNVSKRTLVEDSQVTGVRLVGETLAADWPMQVMLDRQFTDELLKWALAPLSTPPTGQKSRGKIICNCYNVSENEINETCEMGADLDTLKAKLKCGSCVTELKRLIEKHSTNA